MTAAVSPVRAAARAGIQVLFVIPGDGEGSSMIFARRQAESLRAAGVDVRIFFLRSRTSPGRVAQEFRRFRSDLASFRPDVVHAHFGTVTAMFSALGCGQVPLVVTYRGSDLNSLPMRFGWRAVLGRGLSQLAALRAARIVCVSARLRDRLWWRRDIVTILASGVDPQWFHPQPRWMARQRLGWPDADPVLLFNAGRDPRIKRLDLARAAVDAARRKIPGLRWEIMDGGVSPDLVPTLMSAADGLLVTSDREGSPTVIQEALACDLPIISVDAGDAAEKLQGVRHTRLVERDPEALAAAIVELVRTPRRSDGHLKLAEFSASHIAGRLIGIYREILGRTG
jgi:glycosyltransferase involved in cell wall biosynthesis